MIIAVDGFTMKARNDMSEKLKPCPFCGSEDVELKRYGKLFGVECNHCYQPSWSYYTTKRKALEKWNSREDDWLFMGHVDVWESEA